MSTTFARLCDKKDVLLYSLCGACVIIIPIISLDAITLK